MSWLILLFLLLKLFVFFVIVVVLIKGIGYLFYRWRRVSEFWQPKPLGRKLVSNLAIGLSFLYVIIVFPPDRLAVMEDNFMDFLMDSYSKSSLSVEKNIPEIILLDIDDKTYKKWGNPPLTPRDKLKNLIDTAVHAKARLIVVDVNVSPSVSSEKTLTKGEETLKTYLNNYVKTCKQLDSCIPIIFVRAFEHGSSSARIPRRGFLEDVITPSAPYLQWGSAQLYRSKTDRIVRRWRLWEPTSCDKDEQQGITLSIELLVMGIIRECIEDIQRELYPFQPQNCNINEVPTPTSVTLCGLNINTDDRIQRRIMYRIRWSNDEEKPPDLPYTVVDKNGLPILSIFSASPYAKPSLSEGLSKLPSDSIIIIGGSYRDIFDKSDVHLTPIGKMPGALIISNAIYSLLQDKTVKPVPILMWLLIATLFIVVITSIEYYLSSGWWKWLVAGFIIVILGISNVYFFKNGTWLNIAVPLLIIEIYLEIYPKFLKVFEVGKIHLPKLKIWQK